MGLFLANPNRPAWVWVVERTTLIPLCNYIFSIVKVLEQAWREAQSMAKYILRKYKEAAKKFGIKRVKVS